MPSLVDSRVRGLMGVEDAGQEVMNNVRGDDEREASGALHHLLVMMWRGSSVWLPSFCVSSGVIRWRQTQRRSAAHKPLDFEQRLQRHLGSPEGRCLELPQSPRW